MSTEICPCGQPLHYPNATTRSYIEDLIRTLGRTQIVTTPDGSWEVPRHYIALHGIKAVELPTVAEKLGFRRADG